MIIVMLLLVLFIFIYIRYFRVKVPLQTVNFYSGGLGSGKTLLATNRAVKIYKSSVFKHKVTKLLSYITFGLVKVSPISYIYSNYPIKLNNRDYSRVLKREHLLGVEKLPEFCVVVIDEASSIFPNQARKSDLEVSYNFRWFRHFVDGTMILVDQSIGSIDIEIRRRVNLVYLLSNFSKFWRIYSFEIRKVVYAEDIVVNTNNINDMVVNRYYGIFGKKRYNSRYFKLNYLAKDYDIIFDVWRADYVLITDNDGSNGYIT